MRSGGFTSKSEHLENLYRLLPWVEDPSTAEGFKRYRNTLPEFEALVKHEWFKELLGKRRELKIVDLCSGTGIGGVALAKALLDLGAAVSLTLIDLRRDALEKAVNFCLKELGFKPEVLARDVLEPLELEAEQDVALVWGSTTPHFNPWNWIRVLSNASRLLASDGLFLYDEYDRIHAIFYLTGYKDLLPERVEKGRLIVSAHKDKDFKSGYITRLVLNLASGENEEMKVYFWDLASSAAFTWLFFSDVDFIPARRPFSGIIIAKNPRRALNPENMLKEVPSIIREQS
ncbi:MAG: class I SAM-dependent methyltransferase [Thermofilaceae archaeon]